MDKTPDEIKALQSKLVVNSTDSCKTRSTTDGLPMNWVIAIFKKFNSRYLHKWSSAISGIENEVVAEWREQLAGLSGEQISNGLKSWNEDWPPSAPEFKKACLGELKNDLGLDYTPAYHREFAPERILESDDIKNRRKKLANEFFSKYIK